MRNLSTAANVYLKPANNLSSDISIREIHSHIHRCRYELNLFKHSNWPKFVFHVMQYTGQAPVVFPPSWFGRSQDWNPLTRLFRVLAVRPAVDAALESCESLLIPFKYVYLADTWARYTSHRNPYQVRVSLLVHFATNAHASLL